MDRGVRHAMANSKLFTESMNSPQSRTDGLHLQADVAPSSKGTRSDSCDRYRRVDAYQSACTIGRGRRMMRHFKSPGWMPFDRKSRLLADGNDFESCAAAAAMPSLSLRCDSVSASIPSCNMK